MFAIDYSVADMEWPGRRDSNPQPSVPKTDALSIELRPGVDKEYTPPGRFSLSLSASNASKRSNRADTHEGHRHWLWHDLE